MQKLLGCLCWLGLVSLSAGEIVAWKVPLSRYSHDPENKKALEKPPEASPFFRPGDRLWSLVIEEKGPRLDWAVWNETSGTLITKSGMESVLALHQFLAVDQLPLHGRVKVEILETGADEAVDPRSPAAYSLEATGKPQVLLNAGGRTDGKEIQAKVEFGIEDSGKIIYLTLDGSFQLPDQIPLEVETEVILKPGVPLVIAEDSSCGEGMAIRVTASPVTVDGTALEDQVRIQKDGATTPLDLPRKEFRKHRIGENQWFAIAPVPLASLAPHASADYSPPEDQLPDLVLPEGPMPEQSERDHGAILKTTRVPESIAGWFGGPVLDLHGVLRSSGVSEEQDFAGYDVRGNAVVLLTSSEIEAEKLEQLTESLGPPPGGMISVSCGTAEKSRILTRAGRAATLERDAEKSGAKRELEVNPALGDQRSIAMRLYFRDQPSEKSSVFLKTSLELEAGRSLEVHVDGKKKPLEVRADFVEP